MNERHASALKLEDWEFLGHCWPRANALVLGRFRRWCFSGAWLLVIGAFFHRSAFPSALNIQCSMFKPLELGSWNFLGHCWPRANALVLGRFRHWCFSGAWLLVIGAFFHRSPFPSALNIQCSMFKPLELGSWNFLGHCWPRANASVLGLFRHWCFSGAWLLVIGAFFHRSAFPSTFDVQCSTFDVKSIQDRASFNPFNLCNPFNFCNPFNSFNPFNFPN